MPFDYKSLLREATELGLKRRRGTTKLQLAHELEQFQRIRLAGGFWSPQHLVTFDKSARSKKLTLHNFGHEKLALRLDVLDPEGAFRLTTQEIVIADRSPARILLRFEPGGEGAAMTRSHLYRAQLRFRDPESDRLLGLIELQGTSIGRVALEELSCMFEPAAAPSLHDHNSPPSITLRVEPEIVWPGETVHVSWTVVGADEVFEGFGHPTFEVIPERVLTDHGASMGWTAARSASYDIRIGETTRFIVSATNADGSTRADAVVYTKVRVGYHDASTPAGGIPEAEVRRIRGELEDNDRRLNAGCIRNNDELDRFGDPYLRGQLTDDILAAMRQVLIITDRDRLPSRYRETARLCTDGVYGEVPTDKAYLAICREVGADELTLLHELYHYAAIRDSGNEFKAEAISTGCY